VGTDWDCEGRVRCVAVVVVPRAWEYEGSGAAALAGITLRVEGALDGSWLDDDGEAEPDFSLA
jgi:hypothetical protein